MTIACLEVPIEEAAGSFGVISVDENYRIIGFEEKPENPKPLPDDPSRCLASMGIYVFNTEALVHALTEDAKLDTKHDFGHDILPRMMGSAATYAVRFDDIADERRSSGLGDVRLGLRYNVVRDSPVATFDVRVKIPTGTFINDAEVVPVGEGQWDLDLAAEVSRFAGRQSGERAPLVIPDTAINSLDLVEQLEAIAGRPVITANQASLRQSLAMVGCPTAAPGLGALFRATDQQLGEVS